MVCAPVLPCVKESYKPMCRAEAGRQMRYVICQTRYVIYQTRFWCFNLLFKTVYCFAYCCVFSLTLIEIKFSSEVSGYRS